jgi:trans-aconitate methyltransferase
MERFFRPDYLGNCVANWIPSLDGVEVMLKRVTKVANGGCGFGSSTIIMAKAFPHPSSSASITISPRS